MQLIISAQDQVLARYGNALATLGEGQARTALSRALNHEGDKARTQVKRALVKQTGIKYGAVDQAMATIRATPATLTYTLKARGDETKHCLVRRRATSQGRLHARAFGLPAAVRADPVRLEAGSRSLLVRRSRPSRLARTHALFGRQAKSNRQITSWLSNGSNDHRMIGRIGGRTGVSFRRPHPAGKAHGYCGEVNGRSPEPVSGSCVISLAND